MTPYRMVSLSRMPLLRVMIKRAWVLPLVRLNGTLLEGVRFLVRNLVVSMNGRLEISRTAVILRLIATSQVRSLCRSLYGHRLSYLVNGIRTLWLVLFLVLTWIRRIGFALLSRRYLAAMFCTSLSSLLCSTTLLFSLSRCLIRLSTLCTSLIVPLMRIRFQRRARKTNLLWLRITFTFTTTF